MDVLYAEVNEMYPVEIKQKNGLFYVLCKTFNIVEYGNTLDVAYNKIIESRKVVKQRYNELGLSLPKYKVVNDNAKINKYLVYLLVYVSVILPVGAVSVAVFSMRKISTMVTKVEYNLKSKVNSVLADPRHITDSLNKIVTILDSVTPERKAELQIIARRLGEFVKPLADEFITPQAGESSE